MAEFQDGTLITTEVEGCQVHAIGKAIRPPFADPVTYIDWCRSHYWCNIILFIQIVTLNFVGFRGECNFENQRKWTAVW